MRAKRFTLLGLLALLAANFARAETLAIENPEGDVHVVVVAGREFKIDGQIAGRELSKDDVRVEKIGDTIFVDALPADLSAINLFVKIPHGWPLSIKTTSGSITLKGNVVSGFVETGTGAINLSVPIKSTALFIESEERPGTLLIPPDSGYKRSSDQKGGLRIETKDSRAGIVEIRAFSPTRLFVRDYLPTHDADSSEPIPLELARPRLSALKGKLSRPGPAGERRVMVSVRPKSDGPAPTAADFEVVENGERRRVTRVEPAALPLHVALVFQQIEREGLRALSTRRDRAFLLRIIRKLRESDSLAMAQAEGGFLRVISDFTRDRERLRRRYRETPRVKSFSELLAASVLAHEKFELGDVSKRSVAVIVSSAGDYDCVTRSPDEEIKEAVKVLSRTGTVFYAVGGNCRDIDRLAKLSGGRTLELGLGRAEAAADRLAEELTTLYALTYASGVPAEEHPKRLAVKVAGSGVRHGPAVPLR